MAIFLAVLILAVPGFGQLSDEDIAELKEQAARENWTFEISANPATQYSLDELCGLVEPEGWWEDARFDPCIPKRELPVSFDWRDSSACTPVKNQASCGSCWAFGTVGPLESNILLKDNLEVNLSEQWLVSCNSDGWGCDGGWFAHDYHQWKTDPCGQTGAVYESDFPYTATDQSCNCPYPHHFTIDGWSYIGSSYGVPAVDAIKQAILDYGPVSVAVEATSAMQGYDGGIFNTPGFGDVNHAVVLVGWDDTQGTNGVWIMRNSWGSGWGEEGYMRIEYGICQIGYGACYIEYSGLDKIAFDFPSGIPESVIPTDEFTLDVNISGVYGGVAVESSAQFNYSINSQPYQSIPMTYISADLYQVTLPDLECFDCLDFYVSVQESEGEVYNDTDPAYPHMIVAATEALQAFADDFESDLGWTVSGLVDDGAWNRGVPVNGERGDPASDYDGSGRCYLTDNVSGNSDVDGGTTTLISPTFDLSESDGQINYARWYSNSFGNDPYNDEMHIFISNDNGASWVLAETVGPVEQASGGWFENSFWASDFVTPTDQMKLRFDASDLNDGSVVEAAVDAVVVKTFLCGPQYICGDSNGDEIINVSDAVYIVNHIFAAGNPIDPMEAGDANCDGLCNVSDAVWIINFIFSSDKTPCDLDGDEIPDC